MELMESFWLMSEHAGEKGQGSAGDLFGAKHTIKKRLRTSCDGLASFRQMRQMAALCSYQKSASTEILGIWIIEP